LWAKENRCPEIKGKDYTIRRYRNKLYCLKPKNKTPIISSVYWPKGIKIINVQFEFSLSLVDSLGGISKMLWDCSEVYIKPRSGAEKIRLLGRQGHHSLKKLFQEKGIPPWEREAIPLIYLDGQLAAISDLWVSADYCSKGNEIGYKVVVTY
jgi:tRNA(Ile)-lysidine synthase